MGGRNCFITTGAFGDTLKGSLAAFTSLPMKINIPGLLPLCLSVTSP